MTPEFKEEKPFDLTGTKSVSLCLPIEGDPFRRFDCEITDISYSEKSLSIECPEAEAELAALRAENARLLAQISQG